jgi:hypothetical protein
VQALLEKYFRLLPQYQGVPLAQLKFRRLLFGGFPCYRDAPLRPQFDRVLQVCQQRFHPLHHEMLHQTWETLSDGCMLSTSPSNAILTCEQADERVSVLLQIGDAAAIQSPLSFGGFGAMLRHLPRLVAGVDDALRCGRLDKGDLALLQPYQPSLSAAWLFQRCGASHARLVGRASAQARDLTKHRTMPCSAQVDEPEGGAAAAERGRPQPRPSASRPCEQVGLRAQAGHVILLSARGCL